MDMDIIQKDTSVLHLIHTKHIGKIRNIIIKENNSMSKTKGRIAFAMLEEAEKQEIVKLGVAMMSNGMMRLPALKMMMCCANSMCMMNFSMDYDT